MKVLTIGLQTKLFAIFALALLCVLSIHAQTYEVFNASSTPGANGIYTEDGTFNSVPKYTNGNYVMFYANQNMKWAIVTVSTNLNVDDFADSPFKYSSALDINKPPEKGWHHGGNTTGLPGEKIIVTPLNSIGFDKECFVESLSDNGTIKDTSLFYLNADGITFTGTNGDDFILENKIEIENIPSGLTAKAIRKSDLTLSVFLEGTADSHTMKDNTDSLILVVKNEALSNNDISVIQDDSISLMIMYQNPYLVTGVSTATNVNGTYRLEGLFNLKPFYRYNDFYLMVKGCNPKWIIRTRSNVHPIFSSQVNNSMPHNREWHNGGFFYIIDDDINIVMANSINYEKYSFVESYEDNGEFRDSLKIHYCLPYNSSSFSGSIGDNLVEDGKIHISNLPEGLSMSIRKHNDTVLYAKLEGQELSHDLEDNISNLLIEFTDNAFIGTGTFATNNLAIDSLNIVHMSKYIVVDTSNFYKASNGLYYSFDLINNKPAYYHKDDYYLIRRNKSAASCVWTVQKKGRQNALYRTEDLSETPPESNWIVGDYNGTSTAKIEVFLKQPWLSYSKLNLHESEEYTGEINDTCFIVLNHADDAIFNGTVGEDFFTSGKANVINTPEGLTPTLIQVNDTCVYFILSDSAFQHQSINNEDNIILEFSNSAFNISADEIRYTKKYNFRISFNDITGLYLQTREQQTCIVYPNPADDKIFIDFKTSVNNVFYMLFEITGKSVKQGKLESNIIDITGIKKGLYMLYLRTDKEIISKKIMIK